MLVSGSCGHSLDNVRVASCSGQGVDFGSNIHGCGRNDVGPVVGICWNCGEKHPGYMVALKKVHCRAFNLKCNKHGQVGHLAQYCDNFSKESKGRSNSSAVVRAKREEVLLYDINYEVKSVVSSTTEDASVWKISVGI